MSEMHQMWIFGWLYSGLQQITMYRWNKSWLDLFIPQTPSQWHLKLCDQEKTNTIVQRLEHTKFARDDKDDERTFVLNHCQKDWLKSARILCRPNWKTPELVAVAVMCKNSGLCWIYLCRWTVPHTTNFDPTMPIDKSAALWGQFVLWSSDLYCHPDRTIRIFLYPQMRTFLSNFSLMQNSLTPINSK